MSDRAGPALAPADLDEIRAWLTEDDANLLFRLVTAHDALAARLAALAPLVDAAVEYAEASIEYEEKGWHVISMDRVDAARTALQAAYRANAARQQEDGP